MFLHLYNIPFLSSPLLEQGYFIQNMVASDFTWMVSTKTWTDSYSQLTAQKMIHIIEHSRGSWLWLK